MTSELSITDTEANDHTMLKYKSPIMNGITWSETKSSSDLVNLDKFLENEKNNNAIEPWSKLDKTAKIRKLVFFAEKYKSENSLDNDEHKRLITFFKDCLERKKLQRVKDVNYDKDTGEIKNIPSLHYIKTTNHFTLKNLDKRISTTRSLAVKKHRGTVKVVNDNDNDSEDET